LPEQAKKAVEAMTIATDTVGMTRDELLELAEREAQEMLGLSFADALAVIARGELRGSLAEDELLSVKRLLDEDDRLAA
jgi:hypothetical protein